jgi:hypothetical protein
MGLQSTRRDFLGTAATTTVASWVGAGLFAVGTSASPGPNGTINLGLIGYGWRCQSLLSSFLKVPDEKVLASNDDFRHTQVFLDDVPNHKQPVSDVETGHLATNVGHLMNVAYEVGRRDGERSKRAIDGAEANTRMYRTYRAPPNVPRAVETGGSLIP